MNKKKILVATLTMSSVMLSYVVITPIIASIAQAFSQISTNNVQLIITLVPLSAIPVMLVCGHLVFYISKKTITLIGLFIATAGGLIPVFFHGSIWPLYASSVLIGVGIGFISIMSSTIISDYFSGEDKGKVMGYQSACVSIGGALLSYISGKIADFNWVYSYLCFLAFPIVMVVVYFLLPMEPVVKKESSKKSKLPGNLYWLGLLTFLFFVFIYAFNTTISLVLKEMGCPASSAGLATSFYTLVGIIAGLMLARIIRIFKQNTLTCACFISFVGFLTLYLARHEMGIYIGAVLLGFAFAVRNPTCITFAASMVEEIDSARAIAIINSSGQLGAFASPFVLNFFNSMIGGSYASIFVICAVGTLLTTVLHAIRNPVYDPNRLIVG